eukprot:6487388-Prymnesium_polylepis.1
MYGMLDSNLPLLASLSLRLVYKVATATLLAHSYAGMLVAIPLGTLGRMAYAVWWTSVLGHSHVFYRAASVYVVPVGVSALCQ